MRSHRFERTSVVCALTTLITACSSLPPTTTPVVAPETAKPVIIAPPLAIQDRTLLTGKPSLYDCTYTPPAARTGGFYKDDGPLDLPENLNQIPEPLPRNEPFHRWANNPYNVLGQNFVPLKKIGDYTSRGIGSWYGRKFQGQKTSSGEIYDMFQMTAAHPTLPIPSYVRVTNLKNKRSVVVRINDRGPFLKGREIDLSFLAACRLGYAASGSTEVEVVSLLPSDATTEAPISVAALPIDSAPVDLSPTLPVSMPAPNRPEPVAGSGTVFLQLGAFGSRANAENFQAHLARELDEQQATQLAIQQAGSLYRVRLGPFADRASALAEAEKLTGQKNLPAVISR